ncbi:OmpA family protein [Halopseudomonas xinjiangensis]|uniref:OmpA family protein n=1 Tax=Halopseudomonas xinjiangensis TaxID=487184 RepID=A0A1H1P1B7_9GAMM|nr:OmpA family protein [Halopseudomonas xinjiangensis]SDS05021.1 OmpA family protein [Halopseudomonas xinjiangensis]
MTRLLSLVLLALALPAQAMTFQTRMEEVKWSVDGDKFECRLSQAVTGYGEAVFVRRAGERPTFQLKAWSNLMQPGQAQLYNDAPSWRSDRRARVLGQATVKDGPVTLEVPYQQAGQMLAGLADGLLPTIHRAGWANAPDSVRVVVSSIGYKQAWSEFQNCISGLLPMNIDQISRSAVSFASGGTRLDPGAKSLLDTALAYLEADPDIETVQLDAHSDNVGDRLTNRELSRQRALAVQSYLTEHGVAEEKITMRFHGDRYPVASNATAVGRAKNRRVTLRLEKP